ncbi:MAG: diheme cytochrome C-type [Candidatus Rokuibacteriota bacterium]|nr:MAG: diheme cytochrome C-type [Candidatus Rokubacteria bacterium]
MGRDAAGLLVALLLTLAALASTASAQVPSVTDIARGKYVFGATGGCGCHTVPKQLANAGGRRYDGPFGTVYSTNITPDRETGIGSWTDEQIITAIRLGRRPNGERLIPVHPYTTFNGMIADDLQALVAFLRTVPAVKQANQPKKISVPMFESVFLPAWLAAFAPKETPPTSAPTSGTARGEYLVRAVGHCGECHTPRTMTMATDDSRFLAGNPKGPEETTGLTWTEEEIADYLATGNKPDGDVAGGLMGEVIDGTLAGYKDLTKADRLAIARYLKTIPAVKNKIGK